MKSLTIKDLSATSELDRKAMSAVQGGTGMSGMYKGMSPYYTPSYSFSKSAFSFDAAQSLNQEQNTLVNNGNNVAFASGITSNVNPSQTGKNTINFG
jgi:hypothetical protein